MPKKLSELNQHWADKMYSLLRDKTSPGVYDYSRVELIPKGEKYKKSVFEEIDPVNINENIDWATDKELVKHVKLLFHNYRELRRD